MTPTYADELEAIGWDESQIIQEEQNLEHARRLRDNTIWRLQGSISKLTRLAYNQGWNTRTRDQWIWFIYWKISGTFPHGYSPGWLQCQPLIIAENMSQSAMTLLDNPQLYYDNYSLYLTKLIQHQKGKSHV